MRRVLFLLYPLLVLASCGKSEKSVDAKVTPEVAQVPIQLVDKGIYTLPLDSLANFDQMFNLQVNEIDGTEYLSFFDTNTNSFYIHDYTSGTLTKQVKLYREGPNNVYVFMSPDYYLHSLDSIFIDTNFYGYFLINGNGEIISKASKGPNFRNEDIRLQFDQSSYLSEKGIHGSIEGHYKKQAAHFPFLRGTLDFSDTKPQADSSRAKDLFSDYEGIMSFLEEAKKENKSYVKIHRHMMYDGEFLYATSSISDSIRVFRDQTLVKSFYAGVPAYEVIDFATYLKNNEILFGKGQVGKPTILNQPPVYESAFIDPQGKFIYRVMSHGTKAGISPHNGKEVPVVFGATLLVIDLETEERYYYDLPVEEIQIRSFASSAQFVSNQGIHFRVKEQENEDQAEFRLFGPGID